jgi:hypothetical protein
MVFVFLIILDIYRPGMDCADMIRSPALTLERYWAIRVWTQKLVYHGAQRKTMISDVCVCSKLNAIKFISYEEREVQRKADECRTKN